MASNTLAPPASILEKLQARHAIRQEQAQKAATQHGTRNQHESPEVFCVQFDEQVVALQHDIDHVQELRDAQQRETQLIALRSRLAALQQDAAVAAYYLPQYDQRRTAQQSKQLESALDTATAAAAPPKRFSFTRKPTPTTSSTPSTAAAPTQQGVLQQLATASHAVHSASAGHTAVHNNDSKDNNNNGSATSATTTASGLESCLQHIPACRVVRGLTGQTIVHTAAESGSGGEVLLAELTNCTVFILGTLDALWMYALQGCRVYGGPVRGATFVDGATHCCFMLWAGQLRLHHAHHCQAYLSTRSQPIIEHCRNIQVAPNRFDYPGATEAVQAAGLPTDPGDVLTSTPSQPPPSPQTTLPQKDASLPQTPPLWSLVQDFDWIKSTPSPHWSVLPLEQRVHPPQAPPQAPLQAP